MNPHLPPRTLTDDRQPRHRDWAWGPLALVSALFLLAGFGCRTTAAEEPQGVVAGAVLGGDAESRPLSGASDRTPEPKDAKPSDPREWYITEAAGEWDLPAENDAPIPSTTEDDLAKLPNKDSVIVDCSDNANCELNNQATLLTITSNVKGALVTVDGILVGQEGDTLAIKPGAVEVEVRSPDYKAAKLKVAIKAGEKRQVHIDLTK